MPPTFLALTLRHERNYWIVESNNPELISTTGLEVDAAIGTFFRINGARIGVQLRYNKKDIATQTHLLMTAQPML
jgi:hypothetical protein